MNQKKPNSAGTLIGAAAIVLVGGLIAPPPVKSLAPPAPQDTSRAQWPAFRGPNSSGLATNPTPVSWDIESSHNIAWATPIPGLGHSSPVVSADLICVTTATTEGDQPLRVGMYGDIVPVDDDSVYSWQVICLDTYSGAVRWQKEAHRGGPAVKRHPKATHANSTMATDGEHLVAFFGSEGLYCYDMDGNLLWQKSFGVLDSAFFLIPSAQWGFASSPVIHGDSVIVQADVLNGSFIAAFDLADGSEIWRTERDDVPTWSTPAIHHTEDQTQIVVNGYRHIGGYDLADGAELWWMTGGGDIPVPTPVVSGNLIFVTNSHGSMSPIYAIRTSASGDITLAAGESSSEHIAWSQPREGAYMPTPLAYGEHLYLLRDNGVLAVYQRETGEQLYRERLGPGGAGFSASPVAADGKVYFTSEDGDVYVVKAGPQFELLGQNDMAEVCMATPAIADGVLFYRTRSHLVAIVEGA